MNEQSPLEKLVSLTTSVVAVALSISSILGNSVDNDLLVSRSSANNQWSYFQSKSIKQNLYETQLKVLNTHLADQRLDNSHREAIMLQIKDFGKEIARYQVEKNEIKNKAQEFEQVCAIADKEGNILDLAEAFYQISIILSAVSLMGHSRHLWWGSLVFGGVGISLTTWVLFSYFL